MPSRRPAGRPSRAALHFLKSGMAHVILRFRIPDEQPELNAAMQGADAKAVLWAVDQHCRGILKHGEPSAETRRHLEEIREMIRQRPGLLDD